VGWRFITERRAVNLDAGCGWAQGKADVLYVADAFAVMAKVNELLGSRAGGGAGRPGFPHSPLVCPVRTHGAPPLQNRKSRFTPGIFLFCNGQREEGP
jgi:hypothetical protein